LYSLVIPLVHRSPRLFVRNLIKSFDDGRHAGEKVLVAADATLLDPDLGHVVPRATSAHDLPNREVDDQVLVDKVSNV